MPENQVCRRRRPHLQLLRHPMLRTLRRKGHFTVEQGKRTRERSTRINGQKNRGAKLIELLRVSVLTCHFSFRVLHRRHSAYRRETFRRPRRKKITRKIKIEKYPSACIMHGDQVDINAPHVNNVPSSSDTSRDTGHDGGYQLFLQNN